MNNVNVEKNVNVEGGWDRDYHPAAGAAGVGAAVAAGAAVAVTSAVVGSMVRALPHLRSG